MTHMQFPGLSWWNPLTEQASTSDPRSSSVSVRVKVTWGGVEQRQKDLGEVWKWEKRNLKNPFQSVPHFEKIEIFVSRPCFFYDCCRVFFASERKECWTSRRLLPHQNWVNFQKEKASFGKQITNVKSYKRCNALCSVKLGWFQQEREVLIQIQQRCV